MKGQTYREFFQSAMKCETVEEAQVWLAREAADFVKSYGKSEEEAERIIKSNLGYMAGYYDNETAQKVHKLFNAVHPIFGTSTYFKDVTPEAAFEAGRTLGEILKG